MTDYLPGRRMTLWLQLQNALCKMLGAIHASLGLAVLVGGAARFPPPSYQALLDLTHGEVWPYGLVWLGGGLFMMLGHRDLVKFLGLFLSIFITNLWAILFAIAAFGHPSAAFTATVAYAGYGLLSAMLLGFMLAPKIRPPKEGDG